MFYALLGSTGALLIASIVLLYYKSKASDLGLKLSFSEDARARERQEYINREAAYEDQVARYKKDVVQLNDALEDARKRMVEHLGPGAAREWLGSLLGGSEANATPSVPAPPTPTGTKG